MSDPNLLHAALVEASRVIIEAEYAQAVAHVRFIETNADDEGAYEFARDAYMHAKDAVDQAKAAFYTTWKILAFGASDTKNETTTAAVGIAAPDTTT